MDNNTDHTEAVHKALTARRGLRDHLEQNVWPLIPVGEMGRVLTRDEEDQILGYGPEGF